MKNTTTFDNRLLAERAIEALRLRKTGVVTYARKGIGIQCIDPRGYPKTIWIRKEKESA